MIRFNGIAKDYIKVLQDESRPAAPVIRRSTFEIANRHGYQVGRMTYGARVINIPFALFFCGLEDLQSKKEELARWLIHREAKPLEFADEPERIYYAHYTGGLERLDESVSVAKGVMAFTCYDPFKYGEIVHAGVNFENVGSERTPCLVRVHFRGSAAMYRITHVQQGKETRINWSFINNDILEIDMDRRIIRINGHVRMAAFDFRSAMFDILPGQNTLTSNVNVNWTEIRYRPRWL